MRGGTDTMRVYNTTDRPVPAEVHVQGVAYDMVDKPIRVDGHVPKPGDRFFRLLSPQERDKVAEVRLIAILKERKQHGWNTSTAEKSKLRVVIRGSYTGNLVIVRQK